MLVVAIDPGVREKISVSRLVEEVDDLAAGYKIGIPFVLKYGRKGVRELRKATEHPIILDLKLADIGDVMAEILKLAASLRVNAVITHAFVGYESALEILAETAERVGVGLILVVSMSHKGSREFIDKHVNEFVWIAKRIRAHGVVAPATRPDIIKHVRSLVEDSMKIYSPGIGVQGAEPGVALCAGADYEIVGRLITGSVNPREAVKAVRETQLRRWLKCRG